MRTLSIKYTVIALSMLISTDGYAQPIDRRAVVERHRAIVERRMDDTRYSLALRWQGAMQLIADEVPHHFRLQGRQKTGRLHFKFAFTPADKQRDEARKRYVLGPPLYIVSENTDPLLTRNATFELSYWRYGLRTASTWMKRLSEPVPERWTEVLQHLSPLPVGEGVYPTYEGIPDMWTRYTWEHPGLTGIYGMLPGDGVDIGTFRLTFDRVLQQWQMDRIWGWDFPMMAMAAARLGLPSRAIDLLLYDTHQFRFDVHGLATGGPFPYFPSNGGLLAAVAMMAAGWDGAPDRPAPGFPDDGSWSVRAEGLFPIE